MEVNAILFGATGMVGEGVLLVALNNPNVKTVLSISRRPCGVVHPKLKEIVRNDFFNYVDIESELKGYNACFFCLGVSSVGMKEEVYKRITYDLTIATAETLARLNPEMTFCYVSGTGTDSSEMGRQMWARVKGRTENKLTTLPFKAVYNFRPGFIKPVDGQKNAFKLSKVIGKIYPFLKNILPKYVSTGNDIGLAMINASVIGYNRTILENVDIALLANKK